MSKTTKTILIILGVIVVCCCVVGGGVFLAIRYGLGTFAEQLFIDDPVQIQQVADDLADYELPSGYEEEFVMNFLGIQSLLITNQYDGSLIMMVQFNQNLFGGLEEAREQFQNTFVNQYQSDNITFTAAGERSVTIGGQETTLYIYEGFDSQGYEYIQWMSVFQGKQGDVMLMIVGSPDAWNEAEMEAFLESID